MAIPALGSHETSDVAPDIEVLTLGTSAGFANLLADDAANWVATEGATSTTDNTAPATATKVKGTLTAGTEPTCWEGSEDTRCTYQEADQSVTTDLLADTETLTKANSVSGALSDVNTDNAVSRVVSELNTGGGGSGAAPAFVDDGAISSSTGADVTVSLYTGHATNDIIFIFGWVRDEDDTVTMTGYTAMSGFPHDLASGVGRHFAFWKRHDGSESDPLFDKSTTTGDTFVVSVGYSGALLAGDPWEVVGTWGDTTTNPLSLTGITTLTANSLVVVPAGYQDNDLTACTVTGTDPATYTEHYQEAPTGTDGAVCVSEAGRTDAGATGTVTVSWGTLSDPTGGIVLALEPEPAANYELEYRIAFTSETCADTRTLTVNAWRSNANMENVDVQVLDSTETTYTTRLTVTQTTDTATQTYTLTGDEWDSGDVQIRMLGTTETGDTSQGQFSMDYVVIVCDPPADYEMQIEWDFNLPTTTGTEFRLFVEGREGAANPEQLDIRIYAADEIALSGIVCSIASTTESELDCGTLTADQLDGGDVDIQLVDATQAGDTTQSTVDIDRIRVQRTFNYYRLDQTHSWTASVTAGDSYELRLRALRSDENCNVQVATFPGPSWNTRIVVTDAAETLYQYTLLAAERDSDGTVQTRWLGSSETTSDETQSTCTADQEIVQVTLTDTVGGGDGDGFDVVTPYPASTTCTFLWLETDLECHGKVLFPEKYGPIKHRYWTINDILYDTNSSTVRFDIGGAPWTPAVYHFDIRYFAEAESGYVIKSKPFFYTLDLTWLWYFYGTAFLIVGASLVLRIRSRRTTSHPPPRKVTR